MKLRGSHIVTRVLEEQGGRFAFGIPGTHNIELYDAMADSHFVEPVLVTDEQSASFMADGVSRSSDYLGVVNLVPGAGVTHALSGIAESFMDQIPMLVLCCGIRNDTGHAFQLHDVDQMAILRPVVKDLFRIEKAEEIYPTLSRACAIARKGPAGPVAVEIPMNLYLLHHDVGPFEAELPSASKMPREKTIAECVDMLNEAKSPVIYAGNGAKNGASWLVTLAERLQSPVCTTIQGKGIFPENHPLWLWNNFGRTAPPFVRKILDHCDLLLAVGCRFGEVATGSYGLNVPSRMIHVDVDPVALDRNYPTTLSVEADASFFLQTMAQSVKNRPDNPGIKKLIAYGHDAVAKIHRGQTKKGKTSTAGFFEVVQKYARPESIYVTDSGNGTFMAMEHLRINGAGRFLAPVDYSCMGYCVPAAIGAKLANPKTDVIALAGDGALLMTGLELLTASSREAGIAVFVLRDRELSQIVQLQRTTFNRDTCSVIGDYDLASLAAACNCQYLKLETDADLESIVPEAFEISRSGKTAVVEVNIDYSHKTYFTKGIIATNFWRLPFNERLKMAQRFVARRMTKQ